MLIAMPREVLTASFTMFEFKPVRMKMAELGMNRYAFLRYCVLKECGVSIDRENPSPNEKEPIRAVDGSNRDLQLEN